MRRDGGPPKFTIFSAYYLFDGILSSEYEINQKMIEQCFQFCMMTVLDEHNTLNKYHYITFEEFLDMLCRIVIISVITPAPIDTNTHFLLELIIKHKLAGNPNQEWNSDEFKLVGIDEELR